MDYHIGENHKRELTFIKHRFSTILKLLLSHVDVEETAIMRLHLSVCLQQNLKPSIEIKLSMVYFEEINFEYFSVTLSHFPDQFHQSVIQNHVVQINVVPVV